MACVSLSGPGTDSSVVLRLTTFENVFVGIRQKGGRDYHPLNSCLNLFRPNPKKAYFGLPRPMAALTSPMALVIWIPRGHAIVQL